MSTVIGAHEAASLLGVTKPTLYAYVSRGLIGRRVAVDGRTSLYDRDEIEALAHRSRRRPRDERPSIDAKISTAVTQLHDDGPTYRGHDVAALASTHTYEQVTELLLTGQLPPEQPRWPLDRHALQQARRAIAEIRPAPLDALTLGALTLAGTQPMGHTAEAARRLLAIAPSLLGAPQRGDFATRLTRAWCAKPSDELVTAVSCALVLLADHELATSTLGVRVAASVRTPPLQAFAAGFAVVAGPFHGGASSTAAQLFDDAHAQSARSAIHRRLQAGERLPGFGHSVYRAGDPRFGVLLDAVNAIPAEPGRHEVVDAVIAEAGQAVGHLPNIDLALGALYFIGRLDFNVPLFAVARVAGWAAHYDEEITERPVRYRGLATAR